MITAGPTREQIDPVRFISNNSSGKMGYALARSALSAGCEVTLVTGPTQIEPPEDCRVINILSTEDMLKTLKKEFKKNDILIMAAAPADFTPAKKESNKIKKTKPLKSLPLKSTKDILKELTKLKSAKQLTVGFALETDNHVENARRKLKEKSLDMIVINHPSKNTGFDSDTNEVTVLIPGRKIIRIPLASKEEISHRILDLIVSLM